MELLIPGLILVALMVYASTKIKKRAAAAFDEEIVETDAYAIRKPEGFLHVLGSDNHAFEAYSREFGQDDTAAARRATIEMDILAGESLETVCRQVRDSASESEVMEESETVRRISTEETANEIAVNAVYKIVDAGNAIYRLRFAVLPEHVDEYLQKLDETIDSFRVKTL